VGRTTKAVLVAGGALVVAIAIVAAVIVAVSASDDVEVRFADEEFRVGDAESLAQRIRRDATPLPFPDATGGDRPIWVSHVGEDPETGWHAFDGNTGTTEACLVEWDADAQQFLDCEGTTYPVEGRGLPQYPVRVDDDGDLFVDPSP
jgi:hypothetical protein